jgi:hypothetical protein
MRYIHSAICALLVGSAVLVGEVGCDGGRDSAKASSGDAAANSPGPVRAQGGFAAGRVTMADGSPIIAPGARITVVISGVSNAGERVHYSPAVKPDGSYRQKLASGSYRFDRSTVEVEFEGKTYRFRLEPVGDQHNKNRDAVDGITQDFVWKVTGERPGSDHDVNNHTNWYGGSIGVRFNGWRNDINKAPVPLPDGTKVTFTLTPTTATRVDGRAAQPIRIERTFNAQWGQCDALNDIPPAHYQLTGVATLADGTTTKPLLFEVKYAKLDAVQPIRFEPDTIMDHVTTPLTAWVTE